MDHQIIHGDCLDKLKDIPDGIIDLVCTDPPYGYSFMGKDWDKVVPSVEVWKECLRVLKPGGFAFVMSAPRQDVLSQMIVRIGEAGFDTDFTSIYWTYASGFPKAANIGKAVDKRGGVSVGWFGEWLRNWRKENNITQKEVAALFPSKTGGLTGCVANWELGLNVPTPEQFSTICRHFNLPFESIEAAEREVVGKQNYSVPTELYQVGEAKEGKRAEALITTAKTDAAKALDGSYGGFQPKPAVEVIIVAMKPLSEKTYVDQALKNGKGITWLDDARIPTGADLTRDCKGWASAEHEGYQRPSYETAEKQVFGSTTGRFPANLLVSDDVLNTGEITKSGKMTGKHVAPNSYGGYNTPTETQTYSDSGSYSRYFSLDAWWAKTFPFLIVPKASKSEKNRGLEIDHTDNSDQYNGKFPESKADKLNGNKHPTVKPLTLMSYLITLGSRDGDTILDPFAGSCTTLIACKQLNRKCICIEKEEDYVNICHARLGATSNSLFN